MAASATKAGASVQVSSGTGQVYRAEGFDASGHDLGDVSAAAMFTIAPEGTCILNKCWASTAGMHTITAVYGGVIGTVSVTVSAVSAGSTAGTTPTG